MPNMPNTPNVPNTSCPRKPRPNLETLRSYYDKLPREFGFSSKCKMSILGDLHGKSILDVDCRRGKGVVKLADMAGPQGSVVGTDPSSALIDEAWAYLEESKRRGKLAGNCNVQFLAAFPEDLAAAGLRDEGFDVVFSNSSINVGYDMALALREIHRVLAPGGLLVLDDVVAEEKRDAAVVEQARAIGNVVQSAMSRADLERLLADIGFGSPAYYEESCIREDVGYLDDYKVPVVETDEDATFTKTTVCAMKPR